MPRILTYFASAANATLAANLGALLGISFSRVDWRGPEDATEVFQWIAAIFYVLMLVTATVCWGLTGFTEDTTRVVALLPEMTKNGIGIMIAILAATLGVQTVSMKLQKAKSALPMGG
jgi:hypothetical protein